MCASVMFTFCSCTDDSADGTEQVQQQELHISLGSHQLDITRASGDLPSDFEYYVHSSALAKIEQIQCYMAYSITQQGQEQKKNDYIPCVFNYTKDNNNDTWTSTVPLKALEPGNTYYLYGFMPKGNVQGSVNIEPLNNDYKNGAVMTLTNLNAVSPDDICVIVGAKGYDGTNIPQMSSRLGVFNYYPTDGKYIFLLIDHLYAGLQFNMSLGSQYSKLRGIKVRSIKLIPEDGNNEVIETVTAIVTIVANEDEENENPNPIVPRLNSSGDEIGGSVEFPEDQYGRGTNPIPAVLFEGEKELTTTAENFLACFCPATNKKFTLETTYDVYDRKGNPIREGETARNAIELKRDMTAGQIHIVNITVEPTYLYMLSDPDLDNPTFEISSE